MEMKITFPGGARVDAEHEGFVIRTDQPVEEGGGGSAPAPFDYFMASLGTCAGIYVLRFLTSRDLPLEGVRLRLSTERDEQRRMTSRVTVTVSLPAGFPEKYGNAILRAINACSVKKHLLEPPRLATVVEIDGRVAAASEHSPGAGEAAAVKSS